MTESMRTSKWRERFFILIVVLQVLFLFGLAGSYYAIDVYGKEIVLETAPVDPRDIFYGDYVILNYEISRIQQSDIAGTDVQAEKGDKLFVVMRPQGGVYEFKQAYLEEKPEISSDEVVLEGIVDYTYNNEIRVKYGLERYYVPEGTGRAIEEVREGLKVKVNVAPWGKAKISELLLP